MMPFWESRSTKRFGVDVEQRLVVGTPLAQAHLLDDHRDRVRQLVAHALEGGLTDQLSDAPEEAIVAELIREASLEGVRDELPHSIAVVVEEMGLREGRPDDKPLLDIHANLFVERDSQKGIMIGHKGARLREVGTAARHQIEALLGMPVYLDLRVKIAKDWQRDPRQLRRLGF